MELFSLVKILSPFYSPQEGWVNSAKIYNIYDWDVYDLNYLCKEFNAFFDNIYGDVFLVTLIGENSTKKLKEIASSSYWKNVNKLTFISSNYGNKSWNFPKEKKVSVQDIINKSWGMLYPDTIKSNIYIEYKLMNIFIIENSLTIKLSIYIDSNSVNKYIQMEPIINTC